VATAALGTAKQQSHRRLALEVAAAWRSWRSTGA